MQESLGYGFPTETQSLLDKFAWDKVDIQGTVIQSSAFVSRKWESFVGETQLFCVKTLLTI